MLQGKMKENYGVNLNIAAAFDCILYGKAILTSDGCSVVYNTVAEFPNLLRHTVKL